jgi:hypothetical protein
MKPQTAAVLRHLETGKPLTPASARRLYGIDRLGARVHELRAEGYPVHSDLIHVPSRGGARARVARYTLISATTPHAN